MKFPSLLKNTLWPITLILFSYGPKDVWKIQDFLGSTQYIFPNHIFLGPQW